MSNLFIYSHRRFDWNLRWDSTANGAFLAPSTLLPRVTFLRFGRSFRLLRLFRYTSAGWVERVVRDSALSSYSNLAGAPNYVEICGRLPAAPRGWLELRCVDPCAAGCPRRAHIHPGVVWKGPGRVRRHLRAHGKISLCTLQTSRLLCTDA
jgi:hypothetical protein